MSDDYKIRPVNASLPTLPVRRKNKDQQQRRQPSDGKKQPQPEDAEETHSEPENTLDDETLNDGTTVRHIDEIV